MPRPFNELLSWKLELGGVSKEEGTELLEALSNDENLSIETVELLCKVVRGCQDQLARNMLSVLELAAERAEQSDPGKLTAVHVLLARHCASFNMGSSFLKIFVKSSDVLPVSLAHTGKTINTTDMASTGADLYESHGSELYSDMLNVCDYFENCVSVRTREHAWHDASICAALVVGLSPNPNISHFRLWTLLELIAHGNAPRFLPQGATRVRRQAVPTCPVIREFADIFTHRKWKDWYLLQNYVQLHQSEFESWQLYDFVERATTRYAIGLIRASLRHISVVPLDFFTDRLKIEASQLLSGGLTDFCTVEGRHCQLLRPLPEQSPEESIQALHILELTAEYAQRAQGL